MGQNHSSVLPDKTRQEADWGHPIEWRLYSLTASSPWKTGKYLGTLPDWGSLVWHGSWMQSMFLNRSWTRQKKRHYWDSWWNLNYVCGLDGRLESTILSWLGGWHGGNMRKFSLFKEHNKDFLDLNSGWNLSCQYNIGHIKEPLLNLIFLIWRILIAELSWRLNQTMRVTLFACCTSYNQIYLAFLIILFSYP